MLDSFTGVRWGLAVILSSGALMPQASGQPALRVREVGEAPHERGWAIEGGMVGVTLLRRGGHISEIRLAGDGGDESQRRDLTHTQFSGHKLDIAARLRAPCRTYGRRKDEGDAAPVAGARGPAASAPETPAGRLAAFPGSGSAASLLSFVHLCESAPCHGVRALPDAIFNRGVSSENRLLVFVRCDCGRRAPCHRTDRRSDFEVNLL